MNPYSYIPEFGLMSRIERVLEKTGQLVTAHPHLKLRMAQKGNFCYIRFKDSYIELGANLLSEAATSVGEFAVLAKSALYHEASHWLFSPHGKDWIDELTKYDSDCPKVYNMLEDGRIETWFTLHYPKALDYFYLLWASLIRTDKTYSIVHEFQSFLLTYSRKYLPKKALKDVLGFDWLTPKLRRLVDAYVGRSYPVDRPKMRDIIFEVVRTLKKIMRKRNGWENLGGLENVGPDKGINATGADGYKQEEAIDRNKRFEMREMIKEGVREQKKELDREIRKEKQEKRKKELEEAKKAKEAAEREEEEETDEMASKAGELGTDEPLEDDDVLEDKEGAGGEGGEDAEEGTRGEDEGSGEGEQGSRGEAGEGDSDSEGHEEGDSGEGEEAGEASENSGRDESKGMSPGHGAGGGSDEFDFDKLAEELQEKCSQEIMKDIQDYRRQPKREADRVPPGKGGIRGRLSDDQVAKKALELTKWLKGLDSLDIQEKRRKRRGLLDSSRLHQYKENNRIFKKRQLTFGDILNIGILIDVSPSMGSWVPHVIDAARILYRAGRNCKHRIAVRAFARGEQLLFQGFYNPNAKWDENTPVVVNSGDTLIYDALADFSTDFLSQRGRKILFILTDGVCSANIPADRSLGRGGMMDVTGRYRRAMQDVFSELRLSEVQVQYIKIGRERRGSDGLLDNYTPVNAHMDAYSAGKNPDWFGDIVRTLMTKMKLGGV